MAPHDPSATPDAELELVPDEPRDLRATLGFVRRGRGDPTMMRGVGAGGAWVEVWRAQRTPEGTASLRLRVHQADDGTSLVRAAAWGEGAEWSIQRVPSLLGDHDDWSALDARLDELADRGDAAAAALRRVRRRHRGLRLASTGLVLEAAIAAVLEQKVTGLEARRAWRTLVLRHGERAPGAAPEGLTVMPDAVGWRSIPEHDWHRAGVGPQRMATIRRVAAAASALDRRLSSERGGVVPEGAEAALRSIPGVGVWTSAEVLQRSHGAADAVSIGDAHLSHQIGTWFTGDRLDDNGMLEVLAPYAGERQRVVRLITSEGVEVQRFGARATIEDHRRR